MTPAPLAALMEGRPRLWRVGLVLALSWVLAASSWAAIPLQPTPITAQTFAILAVSALSGPRLAFEVVLVWLLQALIGLPLLADGAGGPSAFVGPTAGYLAGFLVAALATGALAQKPRFQTWAALAGLFIVAHMAILALGWAWLAARIGPAAAWSGGVWPFLPGVLIKSLAASAVVRLATPALRALS